MKSDSTKPPLLHLAIYDVSRFCLRLMMRVFFRAKWSGKNNIPSSGGALICANHQSYFDPILVGAGSQRRLSYLARESLFRFGPFAWLIRCYNAIPIQRDGMGIGGLKATLRRLKQGGIVLIFPEGTRSQDGQIQSLKPGFCALVRRGKIPIIPVGIHGAFEAFPRHKKLPRFAKIAVHYGAPIMFNEIDGMSDEELMACLHGKLIEDFNIAKSVHA